MTTLKILAPFQLLELNVISAQDLNSVSRNMKTYAVAWVHPERKLTTRVDNTGKTSPTWNDKFVFRVNEEFIHSETSAIMVEIYALHWFRDIHIGTVRVLISNLMPETLLPNQRNVNMGMRFAALHVRRPSGRPQGILNIGAAILDSSMRSMPLYMQLDASAVGYKTFMGETEIQSSHKTSNIHTSTYGKPELRRSKSDTSSMVESAMATKTRQKRSSSIVGGYESPPTRGSWMVSTSELSSGIKKKGKAGSVINGIPVKRKSRQSQSNHDSSSNSVITGLDLFTSPSKLSSNYPNNNKKSSNNSTVKNNGFTNLTGFEYGSAYKPSPSRNGGGGSQLGNTNNTNNNNFVIRRFITESELGPSASEVAAKIYAQHNEEVEGSELSGWSEGSIEGLRSKLERWRTQLPTVYDNGGESSSNYPSSSGDHETGVSSKGTTSVVVVGSKHKRRHTDGDGGLFSCFSNICGIECSIVCGDSNSKDKSSSSAGSAPKKVGGNSERLIMNKTPARNPTN